MSSVVNYYLFAALIFSLGGILNISKKLKISIIFLTLFFIFGGSHFNGADWINYTNVYDKLNETRWLDVWSSPPFEILFSLTAKLFSSNDLDYQLFIAIIALFNLILLIYLAYKVKVKNISLLFLMIFLIQGWSLFQEQIRQSIAVVICLFSVYQYFKLNTKNAFVLVFIAIGFHTSAIFGLLYLYVASKIASADGAPLSMRNFGFVIGFLVLAMASLVIFTKVISFESILPTLWWQKLNYYINDEISSSSLLNFGLLAYLIGFFILIARRNYVLACKNKWLSFSWSLSVMWCMVGPFFRVIAIFTRFEHFFIILIPFAFVYYEWKNERILVESNFSKIVQIVFALTFTVRLLIQPAQSVWVNDYQNVFAAYFFDIQAEENELRKDRVCDVLLNSGNDFCGILNQ